MSFWVLLRKEWGELVRTYRWLLIPILFLLLSMMNVILTKALPDIITSGMSNLPKGAIIKLPPPTGFDALSKTISQFDQIGVLAIILLFMGSVAGERASGVMTTILVKPVSRASYLGAKLVISLLIITVSYLFSMVVSWYYTDHLFTQGVAFSLFMPGVFVYLPKLLLVVSIVLFFSSLTKSSLLAGGMSLVVTFALSLLGLNGWLNTHSPVALNSMAVEFFQGQTPDVLVPILFSLAVILVLFWVSIQTLNQREA